MAEATGWHMRSTGDLAPSLPAADRASGVPLYLQLAAAVRQRIYRGNLPPGSKIPSLGALQTEFGVARVTVRQAMDRLEREGLIIRHKGKGTFVKSNGCDRHWLHLATQWESLLDSIRDNQPTQISIDHSPAPPSLGDSDATPALEYVFLRSVQARDGDPYSVVNVHLAKDIYDRDPERFQTRAVLPTLADMNDVRVIKARQTPTRRTCCAFRSTRQPPRRIGRFWTKRIEPFTWPKSPIAAIA